MGWRGALSAVIASHSVACGRIGFDTTSGGDGSVAGACTSYGPWGNLTHLPGATTDYETGAWLSPDNLTLWFAKTTFTGSLAAIFSVTRSSTADTFDLSAATAAPFDPGPTTPWGHTALALDDSQLSLYYSHFQATANIELTTRMTASDTFGTPAETAFDQNGIVNTGDMGMTSDSLTLFYGQWATTGGPPEQIYVTQRASATDAWPVGTAIASLSADINGVSPSADGSVLFWPERPAGGTSQILWADRTGTTTIGPPTIVENQGSSDNVQPMLSRDGKTLLFSGDLNDGNGFDIYQLTRGCL
jgi:hypothetical protein